MAVYFFNDKSEVLLVKRKIEPFAGTWDVPGGFVEFAGSGDQSCMREIKEELVFFYWKYQIF